MSDTSFKLQMALLEFNKDKPNWWNWKKIDSNGNKIPNDQRMTYPNIILQDKTATMPSEEDVNNKILSMEQDETDRINKKNTDKASGKTKLKNLGLNDDEIKALTGA
jgi:hypothetical protein